MKKILSIILIISLSILILVSFVEINSFKASNYIRSYDKYKLSQVINKTKDEYAEVVDNIIGFLRGNEELDSSLYGERELLHMDDVRQIYRNLNIVKKISLGLFFISLIGLAKLDDKKLARTVYRGLSINNLVFIVFLLIGSLNFESLFIKFHHVFFKNDLWLLDPETDLLLQIMPEGFFRYMFFKVLISYFALNIAVQIFSYITYKKHEKDVLN